MEKNTLTPEAQTWKVSALPQLFRPFEPLQDPMFQTVINSPDLIAIPVGLFALPAPRTGNIEALSGYGRAAADGVEIHQRMQRRRAKADPLYQAEVPVSRIFEAGGFRFQVKGRIDGIFRHEIPRIEEIKSCFTIGDLRRRLAGDPLQHPYSLQLLSYGYFHWLEHGVLPKLSFLLVSSRNGQTEELEVTLDPARYEEWLTLRLGELAAEAGEALKRAQRRRKIAASFPFPFTTPRPGQVELMEKVAEGMAQGRPMLIQAPTGLGKTVGVLYPALKEALGRGQTVVYVTPKNSQHQVAEDAVERFRAAGAKLTSLSMTAKSKICFQNEPLCTPEYCEFARDYYGKLARHDILACLSKKRKLKARTFRALGEEFRLCPFELQIDAAKLCDVVICDYNYVFAPRSALGRAAGMEVEQVGRPNLVIDEAHNLPSRTMDYYSPTLSTGLLESMRDPLGEIAHRFRREAGELLDDCIRTVASCGAGGRPSRIDPPLDPFLEQDSRLRAFLSRYLESDVEIEKQDPVLRLSFYWSEFAQTLELATRSQKQEFFTTFHPQRGGGSISITCCDASELIRDCYDAYQQVVGFSATLKPFDYYAKLSGLPQEKVAAAEFQSPFPPERRKLMIIPQISTKYSERERNYGRIADAVARIAAVRRGNYFVFLPSFEFLERVAGLFQPPEGYQAVRQERKMKQGRTEELLEILRSGEQPTVVFAVQGGTFSEGVDYAGEMLIGAFVVGPPLPNFDLERELMREYYQRHFGLGFEYAYSIPAMAKAIQSAGRVIRSESDRGIIVLMDSRFLEPGYRSTMPADWFREEPSELVSQAILRDVREFWSGEAE